MIRIQYSKEPYQELNLEGSNQDLAELRLQLLEIEDELVVQLDADYDPSPYEFAISKMRASVKNSLLNISVVEHVLRVEGRKELIKVLADSLPWDAEENCHGHFDGMGVPGLFKEDSLGIVLTLER